MKRSRKIKHPGLPVISLTAIKERAQQREQEQSLASANHPKPSVEIKRQHPEEIEHLARPDNRPWLAARRDAPVCNFTRKARRGNDDRWTEERRQQALEELVRDYTSTSAQGPAASVLRTWEIMHYRMHDAHIPVYPLTADKIARVAAAFKSCGYRSFANYLTRAKEQHIQMYQDWGPDLVLEGRRSVRSVTKGIGPVAQRTPLDIERIMQGQQDDPLNWHPLVEQGPIGPHQLVIVGTFFMLREAEASLLLTGNVKIEEWSQTVTLKLPSSKTDPSAASVDRSWGCLCNTHQEVGCPYHQATKQMKILRKRFGAHLESVPFFPTMLGSAPEKHKVVETFECMHQRLELEFLEADGAKMLGGHSMRLAGARLLSSSGLHLYQVELMARWKSPMLLHYAQTAPLKRLTQEYETANDRLNTHRIIEQLKTQMSTLQHLCRSSPETEEVNQRIAEVEKGLTHLDTKTTNMIKEEIESVRMKLIHRPTDFVQNETSRVWHLVSVDGVANPPPSWSTKCGWKFANSHFLRASKLPEGRILKCDKCWHLDRPAEDTDTSSSSSSS